MNRSIVVVLVLAFNLSFGQSGNYFLSHFAPDNDRFDHLTFDLVQDDRGVFHFASKSGVIEFDGRNWGLIQTNGPIFTLTASGHDVFAGGFNGFGKIGFGADQVKTFQSLSQDQKQATQIFSSLSLNGKIYLINTQSIFVYDINAAKVEATIAAKQNEEFSGLLNIIGKPFVKSTAGIYSVINNKLEEPSFPWPDKLSIDLSATFLNSSSPLSLLSVHGGRLFLATTSGLKEINVVDKDFLIHNVPVSVAWLSETLIAVGTLRGGVIFINPQTGETQEIINYYSGLPDNEVYAMFTDRNDALWVAHGYGFTRIAPFVPFKLYNHYAGIAGNFLCVKTFQNQTYVGTTLGLYCLVSQEFVEDKYEIDKVSEGANQKTKRGLFSFLRRENLIETTGKGTSKKQIKRSGYVFKKVEGIEGKVTQLIETDNQLIASGNFGAYSITELKSSPITSTAVRYVYKSKILNQLLVSTLDDNIMSLSLEGKTWKETNVLDTLNEYFSYIFEDKVQNLWLCGRTNAIKVETVDGAITAVEKVPFSNPTIDESVGIAFGSEVYIASGGSFHRYDIKDNVFKKYDSLPGPKKYFASSGYFWFHDGHRWRTVDPRVQASLKLEWLGLFSNIRFIAPADQESLWLISGNNELFKFNSKQASQNIKDYPLVLREVRGEQNKFAPSHSIIVSQLESTVSFDFIQPDYLGMDAVEYRYQVKGRSNDWTPWSTSNNIVNFSYLPAGTYRLAIQTRNLMGKISAVEEIKLEVQPPYWKRSWFYLLEVIFFGAMVFLSIRLSGGSKKYRVISQVLSMLTIIMMIQLVQTAINNQVSIKTTPVIDFFIQVALALLVLPIENYLMKLMARGAKP
ncbi:MAG TPA: hypothetical protein DGG95_10190 [Cytophagales bacterium]|jgi:hypothetical protein|nr:hypothetical protein [Cytophagales bacterium]